MKNKCNCYHTQKEKRYVYHPITGEPIGHDIEVDVCWGTKEIDKCTCGGDEMKCDFYPEVRERAKKNTSIEDAIEHFKYGISHDIFKEPVTSYAKLAIEALEKQIPVEPLVWVNEHYYSSTPNCDWGYECPCCGNQEIDYPEHHCTCGQALDWDWNEEVLL